MKNLKLVLFISITLSTFNLLGQNIDSLKKEIKNSEKPQKALIYNMLGDYYINNFELDSSFKYFSEALQYSETIFQKSDIYENLGMIYFYKNDFSAALKVFNQSLQLALKTEIDSIIARRYSDIGVVYDYLSVYDKAVEYYVNALEIFQKMDDKKGMAKTLNNLGIINENRGKIEVALKYYQTSLKLKKDNNAPKTDLASTYVNIGSVLEKKKDFSNALLNYFNALKIYENSKIDKYTALTLNNIADAFFYLKNLDSSINYILKAEKLNIKISNNLGLISNFILRSKILNQQNKIDSSIFYLQKALELSNKVGVLVKKSDVLRNLSEIYAIKKDYLNAYVSSNELLLIQDSLYDKNLTDKIETLQTVYETENKENEIKFLEKNIAKNKLLWLATALILTLLAISIFLILKQMLTKSKYRENLFNQRLLRVQMNPHFLFNALTSIQSFMLEKDTKKAAMYLSSFSKLSRSILENSQKEYISLQEEIETIENYLKIQQMRFEDKFEFEIIVDENLDTEFVKIPPMLAQPFVENSINHGFKNINYKGKIIIEYKNEKEKMIIAIIDNGIGIDLKNKKTAKYHAMDITKERLKNLNKNKHKLFSVEINNINEQNIFKGTKVVFSFPVKK